MKRKISLLIAVIMVLSLLPAMSVSADTTNAIIRSGGNVASDFRWAENQNTLKATPFIQIKEDSNLDLMIGKEFVLTLENAEWDVDAIAANQTWYGDDADRSIFGTGVDVPTDDKRPTYTVNGSVGSPAYPINGVTATKTTVAYDVEITTATTATVMVHDTTKTPGNTTLDSDLGKVDHIVIPLLVVMGGTGEAYVSVSDIDASVSSSRRQFAVGSDGSCTFSISNSTTTFSKDLDTVPAITIRETSPGTLKFVQGKFLRLFTPAGFVWKSSNDAPNMPDLEARTFLGFTRASVGQGAFHFDLYSNNKVDKTALVLDLSNFGIGSSTTSVGAIEITGLVLTRESVASETPKGDVPVTISMTDGGSGRVIAGVFADRAVTLTAEDKALPEIVSGVYPKTALSEEIRALDVVVAESSLNAWNTNVPAVFTLNSEAKFRGVEVKKVSNLKSSAISTSDSVYFTSPQMGTGSGKHTTGNGGDEIDLTHTKLIIEDLVRTDNTTSPLSITLRLYVSVKPGYEGDITLLPHEDNEAFTGTGMSAVIAKGINPFTVTTVRTDVNLGYMNVPVGDIIIKENKPGTLKKANVPTYTNGNGDHIYFYIGGTYGVGFKGNTGTVKAEVVSGDLLIDSIEVDESHYNYYYGGGSLDLEIKRESTTASEVKISGLSMDTNRSIPEGKLELRITGTPIANSYGTLTGGDRDWGGFGVDYLVADPEYVNIITAGLASTSHYTTEVSATIGSTTITANGQAIQIDAAPFIEANYTMVPVRAISRAFGFADDQIQWNAATKQVTITDRFSGIVSSFTQGSNYILQNGSPIYFDGPSCMNVQERVFLPFRALGEKVLGVPVSWDEANRTAWFNRTTPGTLPAAAAPAAEAAPAEEAAE